MKKVILILILLLSSFVGYVNGQTKKPVFVGIQPAVTIEPFYEEGEFDVNALPLVFELLIGEQVNLRLLPMLNYRSGGIKNGISDVGAFVVAPIFFNKKEPGELPHGLFVGPVLGFGRNLINDHYTTMVAVEPGYLFETKKKFTIAMGLQLGGSHFTYDSQPNKWVFHWGPKISFGFWLNQTKIE